MPRFQIIPIGSLTMLKVIDGDDIVETFLKNNPEHREYYIGDEPHRWLFVHESYAVNMLSLLGML